MMGQNFLYRHNLYISSSCVTNPALSNLAIFEAFLLTKIHHFNNISLGHRRPFPHTVHKYAKTTMSVIVQDICVFVNGMLPIV